MPTLSVELIAALKRLKLRISRDGEHRNRGIMNTEIGAS